MTLVGRVGQSFDLPVERGKVREFAAAVLAADSTFHEGERPMAPPTFLATSVFWDTGGEELWADAGLDPAVSVHGEQEYVFHGPPPRAGDVLTAQTRIDSDEVKEGRRGGRMRILVTVTEFRDAASGRLVAEERNTGIELGQVPQ